MSSSVVGSSVQLEQLINGASVSKPEAENQGSGDLNRENEVDGRRDPVAQASHDIRSPLAALEVLLCCLAQLPEDHRLLARRAIDRIREISNDLAQEAMLKSPVRPDGAGFRPEASVVREFLLLSSIESLLEEKRLQFKRLPDVALRLRIHGSVRSRRSQVSETELLRVLSNLINNAVEAVEPKGSIDVDLAVAGDWAQIAVQDDGNGITADILERLRAERLTYGKAGGRGLGLSHARETVASWKGSFGITSIPGKGTRVVFTVPVINPSKD